MAKCPDLIVDAMIGFEMTYVGAAIAFFVASLLAESVISWMFIRQSRNEYPQLWRHAGSPTLIGNSDLFRAWPLVKYLMARKFAANEVGEATEFAEKMRLPFIVSYFAALFSAVLLIAVVVGARALAGGS